VEVHTEVTIPKSLGGRWGMGVGWCTTATTLPLASTTTWSSGVPSMSPTWRFALHPPHSL
jgi:hypothetical protein